MFIELELSGFLEPQQGDMSLLTELAIFFGAMVL